MFEYLEKYNFWLGQKPETGLIREFYLRNILKSLNIRLVKVIVGQRRSGKSYILRQIISQLLDKGVVPENIFYFTKEAFEFDNIKNSSQLFDLFNQYLTRLSPKGRVYIFLDEVQLIEDWEKLVNHWAQSQDREYEVFITGSNASLLSSELSTLLSGRYLTFTVQPFSFTEYCKFTGLVQTRENFIKYLSETGLPEALKMQEDELKINYFRSLFDTIVLRDIVSRYQLRDINLLKEIFNFLLRNTGKLTSFTNIVRYYKSKGLKTNYETVANYVQYLANAFAIHQSLRYSLKTKSVLGADRKIYLNDLGFANYLLGFSPEKISDYLENYVFLSLLRFGYQVHTAVYNGREIDFIASKHSKQLLVQVSQTLTDRNTYVSEVSYFISSKTGAIKLVIHLDDINYSQSGINFIKAWELEEKLYVLESLL